MIFDPEHLIAVIRQSVGSVALLASIEAFIRIMFCIACSIDPLLKMLALNSWPRLKATYENSFRQLS